MSDTSRELRRLRESGAFIDATTLAPRPKPRPEMRRLGEAEFAVERGMKHYFWPFLAWVKLVGRATSLSYVSFLEQIDRREDLFFGLEAYVAWRADRGVVLLGWVEHRNVADALAELGHLEEVRCRLHERLQKLGPPHTDLAIELMLISPALEFDDVAEYVDVDASRFVGASELSDLGARLDEAVSELDLSPTPVEHLLAAVGVLFDHEFPSQPLTSMPAEYFDEDADVWVAA